MSDVFCANTSIVYEGEQIAIWNMTDELPTTKLVSKIVHEMFHGYQTLQGWNCFADEMEALCRYKYDADNLCLKLRENELLLRLYHCFDVDSYKELLSHRKYRSEKYPYEYSYESKVEEIEGTATYVEWMTLKQLDTLAAEKMTNQMCAMMTNPEKLFPIRISCYYSGAFMVSALSAAGAYSFSSVERPVVCSLLKNASTSNGNFPEKESFYRKASDALSAFEAESRSIINSALKKNEVVLTGPLELLYVNIYDARFYNGYMTSNYFILYRDENGKNMLNGSFVIETTDGKTIAKVYSL